MNFFSRSAAEKTAWVFVLGLVVFFSAWRSVGLQPDAALYAGLSAKVLASGEAWRLSGSYGYFPIFYEHPPFFFQWGAQVLRALGPSDGAARAIGGLPGVAAFWLLVLWAQKRLGSSVALWTAFALATFGHYTKFASTAMMEGPLSLGVILAAIGVYEVTWESEKKMRLDAYLALAFGLALATAAKGVAGLGAFGGVALAVIAAAVTPSPARNRFGRAFGLLIFSLIACLAPLLFWIGKMISLNGVDWIAGYFVNQVFGSVTSTRGDLAHASGGSVFFYLKMIVLNGWPWWWTVPACAVLLTRAKPATFAAERAVRAWSVVAWSFFFAFALPFSLVKFQLAHYIHPTYLVLAPLGGYFLDFAVHAVFRKYGRAVWPDAPLRWITLAIAAVLMPVSHAGVTRTPNRGQDFIAVRTRVIALPENCAVIVSQAEMDPYRAEANALWYWRRRAWRIVPPAEFRDWLQSYASTLDRVAFWIPSEDTLVGTSNCPVTKGMP